MKSKMKDLIPEIELENMEKDDGIEKHPKTKRHPNEFTIPVGEQFIPEELDEQGYTEEGLGTPDNGDAANPKADH